MAGLFQELQGAEARLYATSVIEELTVVYTAAQTRLRGLLAQNQSETARWRHEQLLSQVNDQLRALDAAARKWAATAIPGSFRAGGLDAARILESLDVTRAGTGFTQIQTRAVAALADQTVADLLSANGTMKTQLTRYVRAVQGNAAMDQAISRAIEQGLLEGASGRTINQGVEQALRRSMGQEQFIVINGRHYTPENYAALVARTRTREATTQGTVMTNLEFGNDLVQWDVHAGACPICQTHMGRVYSISGSDPDFPMLEAKPPVHPHCLCNLFPAVKEIMKMRGTYDAMSELSQSSPSFQSEKDAQNWLNENPDRAINTLDDLNRWVVDYPMEAKRY